MSEIKICAAREYDATEISACVKAAYSHYIERLGKPPGPMLEDYADVIAQHQVFVARANNTIVGMLVLKKTDEDLLLDNIAILPFHQGLGLGRNLMQFAEHKALEQGYTSLSLYTHLKMTENIAMYKSMGYFETERREEKGYQRIYMGKKLKP